MDPDNESKTMLRTIQKARLFDVSPVTFPAYSQTEVHVRMTRFESVCLVEDEVIEVAPVKPKPEPPAAKPVSEEELEKQFEELKKSAF